MRGEEYCLVSIAEPIPLHTIDAIIKNLFDLSASIHSQVKATVQKMKGSSDTVNVGMMGMSGDQKSTSVSESAATGDTYLGTGQAAMQPGIGSAGAGIGAAIGTLIVPGLGTAIGGAVGGLIGSLGGLGYALLTGSPLSRTESWTQATTRTIGKMTGLGAQGGYARGWNRSRAVTQEILNKTAEYCEKLCDAYIERLQAGKNLGLWNVGVYLLTDSRYTQLRAQGLLRAALSGDTTYWEPIRTVSLNNEAVAKYLINFNNPKYDLFLYGQEQKDLRESVTLGQKIKEFASKTGSQVMDVIRRLDKDDDEDAAKLLEEIRKCPGNYSKEDIDRAWNEIKQAELGHPFGEIMGGVSTPLNTEELSIIMNVPRQEVQGVTIREAAPFGINYSPSPTGDDITIGRVIHKRTPMDEIPYLIPRNLFQKHAFVCGVTGSGKTNTCITILRNMDLPFMVVEPAKTEYRQMLNFMPDLEIFTLGSETVSPFRINPFEFTPGGELLTHIDSIKAVFNAAFPMYASMPYILEEAIIGIYRDKGWDLATSTNRYFKDLHSDEFFDYLPTLQDLYDKIEPIVQSKQYAQEQTMNIQAALLARLSSLLTGSKGLMLNTRRSTPISTLLNRKTVLELKNIGDDDEKCFMMGLILSAIYQYRENSGGIGSPLNHVLLIEEAHRLLRKTAEFVSPEIGNSRGKAVETFTNVISEIREYGQGVIIVDQIPSKLTPDVVKNTNIKIIHRTLALDDREYIGSTMNLTEAQDRELCLLEVGQAVIHREGADKAFLVQVDISKDGKLKRITNENVKEHMKQFHADNIEVFCRYPGFEKIEGIAEAYTMEDFGKYSDRTYFGVIGALIIMIYGDAENLSQYKKAFNLHLKREFRVDDDIRRAVYLIRYSNLFFGNLNESFPGCLDECNRLHRIFIDCWFDGNGQAEIIDEVLKRIFPMNSILDAFLNSFTKRYCQQYVEYFKTLRAANYEATQIKDALRKISGDLLFNVELAKKQQDILFENLLGILSSANPEKSAIIGLFRKSL
jgi:hypothetical protein